MYVMNEGFIKPMVDTHLDEMARVDVQDGSDGLPFRLVVNLPDVHEIPHVHILALDSKQTELGTFVITDRPPKRIGDFVEYRVGPHKGLKNISAEWLVMIIRWARRQNLYYRQFGIRVNNWRALLVTYGHNRRKAP